MEYSSQKIAREAETDPHLFSCTLLNEDVEVTEVYDFNQDDMMTEDIFILDCHSDIYVWVGQQVQSKKKMKMHGDSFQRKLSVLLHGVAAISGKPKRRIPISYGRRSAAPEKSQRSRSVII